MILQDGQLLYFKYLDLDYSIVQQQILNYLNLHPELISPGAGSWRVATDWILKNTDIQNLFEWEIEFIGIFVTHTNKSSIHIDNDQKPVRINFPILNCENTITKYYKFKGNTNFVTQPNGVSYNNIDSDNVEEIDFFNLDSAVLMRVLEPHQVCVNHNNFPRVSCTVQFKENLEYLLETQ